jgi:hypothetical protein
VIAAAMPHATDTVNLRASASACVCECVRMRTCGSVYTSPSPNETPYTRTLTVTSIAPTSSHVSHLNVDDDRLFPSGFVGEVRERVLRAPKHARSSHAQHTQHADVEQRISRTLLRLPAGVVVVLAERRVGGDACSTNVG